MAYWIANGKRRGIHVTFGHEIEWDGLRESQCQTVKFIPVNWKFCEFCSLQGNFEVIPKSCLHHRVKDSVTLLLYSWRVTWSGFVASATVWVFFLAAPKAFPYQVFRFALREHFHSRSGFAASVLSRMLQSFIFASKAPTASVAIPLPQKQRWKFLRTTNFFVYFVAN